MANRDILIQAFDAFRLEQEMTKVAGLEYYQGLTKKAAEEEFLTRKFIKVAQMQGKDPWELAYQIANSMDRLEKVADQMPLFRYYLEWADEMEKKAGIALLRGLGAAAKAGLKGMGRSLTPGRFRAIGGGPTQGMGQAFKATVGQTRQIQAAGGGSFRRGKKLMMAETGVDPTKLKGPQTTVAGAPKATGGPKPAPAGAPAGAPAPAPAPQPNPRDVFAQGPAAPPKPAQAYAQNPQVRERRVRQQAAQAAQGAGPQGPAQQTPPAQATPQPKVQQGDRQSINTAASVAENAANAQGGETQTPGAETPLIDPARKNQIINALIGAGVLAAPVAAYQAFKPQQQGYAPRY